MGMPLVTLLAPTFDDANSVNLRVYIDNDGGSPCTLEWWVWSEVVVKPGYYRYAVTLNKTTGSTVQNHTAVLGFKYQQSFFVRAINGADSYDSAPMEYWPILDRKGWLGQPWKLISYTETWAANVLTFWCNTDIPCHLFLAWSDHEPFVRSRAHQKRGTVMWHDGEHGLTVNGYVEQTVAGDTRVHTIDLPFPAAGGERWWFLFGDVDNRRSPSRTGFWSAEYVAPLVTPQIWTTIRPPPGSPMHQRLEWSAFIVPERNCALQELLWTVTAPYAQPTPAFIHCQLWSATSLGKPLSPLTPELVASPTYPVYPGLVNCDVSFASVSLTLGGYYALVRGSDHAGPKYPSKFHMAVEGNAGSGVSTDMTKTWEREWSGTAWGTWHTQRLRPQHLVLSGQTL